MLYHIRHTTTYHFDRPVFLEPHVFQLRPRCDGSQQLLDHQLFLDPEPVGCSACLDSEGNVVSRAWFQGMHERLTARTESQVKTERVNPFDFLVEPDKLNLPMAYPPEEVEELKIYRQRVVTAPGGDPVLDFARRIADDVQHQAVDFLARLAQRLPEVCRVETRDEGDPFLPHQTLEQAHGACRDLTVLFMDAARALGLAARFVSGYHPGDLESGNELHAWAEVFLPGGGWRGFDPTLGLAAADHHMAVAAAPDPAGAAPVIGAFRGTGAQARLEHHVQISGLDVATEAMATQSQTS